MISSISKTQLVSRVIVVSVHIILHPSAILRVFIVRFRCDVLFSISTTVLFNSVNDLLVIVNSTIFDDVFW